MSDVTRLGWVALVVSGMFLGGPEAWAVPQAELNSESMRNYLIVPNHTVKGRDHLPIYGIANGTAATYTIHLWRHNCAPPATCANNTSLPSLGENASDPRNGEWGWPAPYRTLISGATANKGSLFSLLLDVPFTTVNGWLEGEYVLELIVTEGAAKAYSRERIFVDTSFDPSFNALDGVGAPKLKNALVYHGATLADVTGDTRPELIVGTTLGVIYAYDGIAGDVVFQSCNYFEDPACPVQGAILGSPSVGDVLPGGGLEIVATVDIEGAASLVVFDPPDTWNGVPRYPVFSQQIGASRSSPALRKVPGDTQESIFVTTVNNQLHWFKYDSAAGTLVKRATQNLCSLCPGNAVMETTPLLASLQATTPFRVFVPSLDANATYGFAPLGSGLQPLPGGFPVLGIGGTWDAPVGYYDNDGELELIDVAYSAAGTTLVNLEVQGATFVDTTPRKEKKNRNLVELDDAEYFASGELFMYRGASVGDLDPEDDEDDNGIKEPDEGEQELVVVGMTGKVYLFDEDLELRWVRQMGGTGVAAPLIADVDGDNQPEIITTSSDQLLYAWDKRGNLKRTLFSGEYGFPRSLKSLPCISTLSSMVTVPNLPAPWRDDPASLLRCASPAVGDVDGDGAKELIQVAAAGSETLSAIYMWDLFPGQAAGQAAGAVSSPEASPWPMSCGPTGGCDRQALHATIRGTVRNTSGGTITNATITVSWTTPDGLAAAISIPATGGSYSFDRSNPRKTYNVEASAPGYVPQTKAVVTTPDLTEYTVDFQLRPITAPPLAPDSLVTTPDSTTAIKLTWIDRSDTESQFEVHRSASAAGPFTDLPGSVPASLGTGASVSFTDQNLTPNTPYYYRVYSYNSYGLSTTSASGDNSARTDRTLTRYPTKDTFVAFSAPTANYGALDSLRIGGRASWLTGKGLIVQSDYRANLQFTIPKVPSGEVVQTATLSTFLHDPLVPDPGTGTVMVKLYAVSADWNEYTITNNDQLTLYGENSETKDSLPYGWNDWVITPPPAADTTITYVLITGYAPVDDGIMWSREAGLKPPQLVLTVRQP